MLDPRIFDDVVKHFMAAVPPGLQQVKGDLEQNLRSILQSMFAKLDLVSREEFDVQAGVLARTRAKLEALEAQVKSLEEQSSVIEK